MEEQSHMPTLTLLPSTTTTTVTTTTKTTTHYPPIPLPRPPSPSALVHPRPPLNPHARAPPSPQAFPLLHLPLPPQTQAYLLPGAGAAYHDGDPTVPPATLRPSHDRGQGWVRMRRESEPDPDILQGGSLRDAIERYISPSTSSTSIATSSGKGRKRVLSNTERGMSTGSSQQSNSHFSDAMSMSDGPPSPPPPSPPRKKARPHPSLATHVSTGLHPLPSPSNSPPPSSPALLGTTTTTTRVSPPPLPMLPLQTLLSLPTLLTHYASLPAPLQTHVLLSLLRLSPLSVLRASAAFLAPALARDFLTLLPAELALYILHLLPLPALLRAARVCKTWRALIDGEGMLWRAQLRAHGLWFDAPSRTSLPPSIRLRKHQRPRPTLPTLSPAHPYKLLLQHRLRLQLALAQPPTQLTIPLPTQTVVTCLQLSSTRIVSASDEHTIHVHSPRSGLLLASLAGHSGGVWALQFVRDTLVSGSTDRTVRVWDLRAARNTHVFAGHTSTVRCLQIIERGEGAGAWPKRRMVVTGSRDNTLRLWILPRPGDAEYKSPEVVGEHADREEPGRNPYHVRCFVGHSQAVRALAARGRTLVSGSYDCTVRVWDLATGECRHVLSGHAQKVYSVTLDPVREHCASGSMDGTVRIWSLETGDCLHALSGHTSLVGLLSVRPTQLISAAADSTLRVWSPTTGALLHTLAGHPAAITCFLHDEFRVLSGSEGSLKMWDAEKGEWRRDLLSDVGGVWQVAGWGRRVVSACNRGDETFLDVFEWGDAQDGDDSDADDDEDSDAGEESAPRDAEMRDDAPEEYASDYEDPYPDDDDEVVQVQPWEVKTPTPAARRSRQARFQSVGDYARARSADEVGELL